MQFGIVLLEVAQRHDSLLAYLNFVNEEERLARYDGDGKRTAEFLARSLHVDVLREQLPQIGLLFKVHLHKVAELLSEFSYGSGLAHLTGTPYQQRLAPSFGFPLTQFVVYVSFEIDHLYNMIAV